jgi:hypothetical protein
MSLARFDDYSVDNVRRYKGSRSIMNRNDSSRWIQVLEAIAHRIDSFLATDGDEQPIDITLKEPRRRIAGVSSWKNDYDHSNVGAFLKLLDAVQQHRLAADPAELL